MQRPSFVKQRTAAVAQLAAAARAALAAPGDAEPALYAIAAGLYEPGDRRFGA